MWGNLVGGLCLLACLYFVNSEEINDSQDVKDWSAEDNSRSGAMAESYASSNNDGQALSQSNAESSGGGTASSQALSSSYGGVNSAKAISMASGDGQALSNSFSNADKLTYPYGPGLMYGGGNSGTAESSAKAQASSTSGQEFNPFAEWNQNRPIYQPGYVYPGTNSIDTFSQAEAKAISGGNFIDNNNNPMYNGYQPQPIEFNGISSAEANAQSKMFYVKPTAPGMTEVKSRVISAYEFIYPHLMPGYENAIKCSRPGELHYLQIGQLDCMVCVCVVEKGLLLPTCTSCSSCSLKRPGNIPTPPPLFPTPPSPIITPIKPVPDSIEPQVSCSPLPVHEPFENPMNPCQICVCFESLNYLNKKEVRIECKENPQCVIPQEVSTLPPLPDGPTPLPKCDEFPLNVVFPHPNDACKICKCTIGFQEFGKPQPQIECTVNPECNPVTYRPDVSPFPDFTTVAPWLTTSTLRPTPKILPGPLPGPKPHNSCRPYTPDQPFDHPWDECQICVCSESSAYGVFDIEVNCYTKKSCCYEPGDLIGSTPLPPYGHDLQILDPICEMKTFGVDFPHPQNPCKTCVCDVRGNVVKAVCFRSANPECQKPFYFNEGGIGSANGQGGSNDIINFPPGVQGYRPGLIQTNQGSLNQHFDQTIYNKLPEKYYDQYQTGGGPGYWNNQGGLDNKGMANKGYSQWGMNQGFWSKHRIEGKTDTLIGPQKEYIPLPTYYSPQESYKNKKIKTLGGVESLAEQEALNAWLQGNKKYSSYYQGYNQIGNGVKGKGIYFNPETKGAKNIFDINNSGYNGYTSYNALDGIPASSLYPDLYSRPSYEMMPLYINDKGYENSIPIVSPSLGFDSSGGFAKAQSSALSQGSSNAKSHAEAGTLADKSGKMDDFDGEQLI